MRGIRGNLRVETKRVSCQVASSPALADRWCSPAPHAWPFLRPCALATSATLQAHSPAALVAGVAHGPALALPSDCPRRFGDRSSPPPAGAPVLDARESSPPGDNSCGSPTHLLSIHVAYQRLLVGDIFFAMPRAYGTLFIFQEGNSVGVSSQLRYTTYPRHR